MKSPRLAQAIERIDAANAADPRTVSTAAGQEPAELVYGRRMSEALDRLQPNASELLRLAVRAQHIERWKLSRQAYPEGKAGYHRWRTEQKRRHAETAGAVLAASGYAPAEVERVQSLILKQDLKRDPEAQTLEDVACLVFVEHHLAEFASRNADDKVIDILAKTWRKMSPAGQAAALAIELPPQVRRLVAAAVQPSP